jgi:hypothetical protein
MKIFHWIFGSMVAAATFGMVMPVQADGHELSKYESAETLASIARGGQIYDKWYKVLDKSAPKMAHPAYPGSGKYASKPKANWRCKECHGWDGRGKDGAYSTGKHYSGIKGISGYASRNKSDIASLIKGSEHGYGDKLNSQDVADLSNFI